MELREEIARIIAPTLWNNPTLGIKVIGCSPNANIKGLQECVMIKVDRLIAKGYIKNDR